MFEQTYPHITEWVTSWGWIEIGNDGMAGSFIRALNEGGLVWENDRTYPTLDDALQALEAALADWMK